MPRRWMVEEYPDIPPVRPDDRLLKTDWALCAECGEPLDEQLTGHWVCPYCGKHYYYHLGFRDPNL